MNKRHYEHTLPNIRGSLSNTYCKGQISRIFASLFPNYGRKSYDYGEISTLLWGEQPANT